MFLQKFLNRATLNTAKDFSQIRNEVREFGIENFKNHLRNLNIIDKEDKIPKDSNFFAKQISKSKDDHILFSNLPDKDENWMSDSPEYIGRASMSKTHKLLVIKDFSISNFNVIFLGIENDDKIKEEAIKTLNIFEQLAFSYGQNLGISEEDILMYFHCYPTNSINITHLHILDKNFLSPSFYFNHWKNLSLDDVRRVIIEEI